MRWDQHRKKALFSTLGATCTVMVDMHGTGYHENGGGPRDKTTSMSAQYIPYSRAQKAIVAQVMASMNWTKPATATECLYVHFMV